MFFPDKNPPLGPLPPLVGRRGPGKQSSMAVYSQSLQDPADTEEAQTGNIRGCLPPQLRGNWCASLSLFKYFKQDNKKQVIH